MQRQLFGQSSPAGLAWLVSNSTLARSRGRDLYCCSQARREDYWLLTGLSQQSLHDKHV